MQPYVILKQPGKLVFYLFTIMLLIVRESHEHGPCSQNCFGPVTKIKIYNDESHGFLHVNGDNVVATAEGDGIIYKISARQYFYLYDMKAEKFICWRKARSRLQRMSRHNATNKRCQFIDKVPENGGGYVNLVPAFNNKLKMRFNKNGSFIHGGVQVRHRHRQANFVIDDEKSCKCPEARLYFCKKLKFAKMKIFKNYCRPNEIYDF